ncbi:hypothetical protein ACOME3_010664, partial [Neoechinorhynchus agilis]
MQLHNNYRLINRVCAPVLLLLLLLWASCYRSTALRYPSMPTTVNQSLRPPVINETTLYLQKGQRTFCMDCEFVFEHENVVWVKLDTIDIIAHWLAIISFESTYSVLLTLLPNKDGSFESRKTNLKLCIENPSERDLGSYMCRDDSSVMSIVHVANYSSSTEQLIPLYIQNSSTSPVVTITTVPLPTSMDEKEPVIKCNHQTVPTCFNIIVCKTSVSGIILYGILTNPAKVKSRRHIKPGKWIINQTRNDFVFNLTSSYPMPTLNFSVFSYHADQQMIWSTNIS